MDALFFDAMHEVLQQPRYDRLTGRRLDIRAMAEDALVRLIEWLAERFNFSLDIGPGINTDIAAILFAAVGTAVLAVLAIVLIRRIRITKQPQMLTDVVEELVRRNLSPRDWVGLSGQYADNGQMREAVRYRYMAVLANLHMTKMADIKPSKTNAQIAAELKQTTPGLVTGFREVADTFHRAWFGHKTVESQDFDAFAVLVESLIADGV
jgi:hypothetical protein